MLMIALRAEILKLRRNPVWLVFLVLPLISAIMGTFNYLNNTGILKDGWFDLWTQHTLFLCGFFMPALIGIYCAALCRIENFGRNWNAVMSAPVPRSSVFFAKLIEVCGMVVLTQVWVGVLFAISGKLTGLESAPPAEGLIWLACGTMGGFAVCAVQLFLSLVIRSFAVPVGIALIGGIAGFLANARGLALYIPYGLISAGMNANHPGSAMLYGLAAFFGSCALFFILFSAFGLLWLKKRDVSA